MSVFGSASCSPTQSNTDTNSRKWIRACLIITSILTFGWTSAVILDPLFTRSHHGKEKSLHSALQLRSAISAYYTEYRRYPVNRNSTGDANLLSDHNLMDALLSSNKTSLENELNPRKITFYAGKKARMSSGKFRNGIGHDEQGRASLFDQWGNLFRVRFDSNLDNQVALPYSTEPQTPNMIPESIIVWSAGEDQIDGTSDDIKTW